jgi:CBS domain-containing protein/catechol 2,3-dioxygenase-like lactoylglutathione lyase family enzyme
MMKRQPAELERQTDGGFRVADVMRPAVTTVETGGHLAAAAYVMNHADQSALVVVDEGHRPVAMITEADLLRAIAHGAETGVARVNDWMDRNPQTVRPETSVTEAARLMVDAGKRHLPVVADARLVGIVGVSDLVDSLIRSVRLASVVLSVSDLTRSVDFYQPLLRYTVVARNDDAALLTGPDGSQLYLRAVGRGAQPDRGTAAIDCAVWTAGGPGDMDRCMEVLTERDAFTSRTDNDGVDLLQGSDPDGLPVFITYPGPDQAPRHVISGRLFQF